ncbi:ArsR family transcriptional regulator [Streptomyces triticagri]|uniref:ArsR family transcriptional regulator n=1 Tax=Streptomyces triticagri TaxID=2293568 RepID=A0A372LW33_9ACTN|nr:winged helix-turn-helix domain-containing protein [Streptomyces triticagri]RFU82861.1 ArsR family transcriptional regulator [Streptomyces triticagri]
MELEERVAELERRIAALEKPGADAGGRAGDGDFWALEGFKEQLGSWGAEDGGVLFTGAVRLPTGERWEWQQAALTDGQLGPAEDSAQQSEEGTQRIADGLAALGHPVRIRLLRAVLAGRRTAADLSALDGIGTTGQIYHHLRQLSAAGWLTTTGRGRYAVPGTRVVPLLTILAASQPP